MRMFFKQNALKTHGKVYQFALVKENVHCGLLF